MRRGSASSRLAPPGAFLTDDVDRRAGCGTGQGQGSDFLVRDGQMDGSQEPADLSAPVATGAGGLTVGSLQVRPRRSRRDILRRMVLAEDEQEDEDDEADANEPEGSVFLASRGLRGGDADLARRGRGDRPSMPPSPSSLGSTRSVSCRMGERQPTRMRPETKSSSAELMAVLAGITSKSKNSKISVWSVQDVRLPMC